MNPRIRKLISGLPLTRDQVMSQLNDACEGTSVITDPDLGLLEPDSNAVEHVRYFLRDRAVLADRILALRELLLAIRAEESTARDHRGNRMLPHCVVDSSQNCVVWTGIARDEACALDQCYWDNDRQCPGEGWGDLVGREISPTAGDDWQDWDSDTLGFDAHLVVTQLDKAERRASWYEVTDYGPDSAEKFLGGGGRTVLTSRVDRPEVAIAEYMCRSGADSKHLRASALGRIGE